jgi:hypothetical protein
MNLILNKVKSSKLYIKYLRGGLFGKLIRYILNIPLNFEIFVRKTLDLLSTIKNPKLFRLHLRLRSILNNQNKSWPSYIYAWGYFYQGFDLIKINGIRNTEYRLKSYNLDRFLNNNMVLLDIGANACFLAIALASKVSKVIAIEWNPFQLQIGSEVANYLKCKNIEFINDDYLKLKNVIKVDAICSFANHHTTDGGMRPELRMYFEKLYENLNPNGILFFESHPHDKNPDFLNFIDSLNSLFLILEKKEVRDSKLGGERFFYVFKKI